LNQSSAKRPSPISDSKTRDLPAAEANDLSSNTTDDGLDAPVTCTKCVSEVNPPASQKGTTKLGILGGGKRYQVKAVSPSPRSPERHSLETQDDSTNRAGNDRVTQPSPSKPKGKLGKIGGHRKVDKEPEEQTVANDTAASYASRPKKEVSNAESGSESGRGSVKKPKRETSEDRADRNRERLKRELEEKGKVVIKKKRKF